MAKRLLEKQIKIKWYVIETEAMARKGKNLENDELLFFDNLTAAKNSMKQIVLLFSSGALQYVPEHMKF